MMEEFKIDSDYNQTISLGERGEYEVNLIGNEITVMRSIPGRANVTWNLKVLSDGTIIPFNEEAYRANVPGNEMHLGASSDFHYDPETHLLRRESVSEHNIIGADSVFKTLKDWNDGRQHILDVVNIFMDGLSADQLHNIYETASKREADMVAANDANIFGSSDAGKGKRL